MSQFLNEEKQNFFGFHLVLFSLFVVKCFSIFFSRIVQNKTTTRDSVIYFHPHTKCSWFVENLEFPWRASGIALFSARRVRCLVKGLEKETPLHSWVLNCVQVGTVQRPTFLPLIYVAPFVF